ncbi:OLC1v1014478C1 [Oldenlandia corymbosa var. corymbosa]|uniref:OLC1v1014478C1 n=1 Tax=Oldenlandia corymbosa var. corymbosa TaxID=529605 RepID=A0AAV1E0R1_OLDCO|nr:OLC1v1014478C1 [Oldenlandia corymbosa var. corymbosa]
MATSAGRGGAQTLNSMYFKPMLRKAFHRKSGSPDMITDTAKLNGEEVKNSRCGFPANYQEGSWWVPDDRTGIFYPKGQEKVMENVPTGAAKDIEPINWFSYNHDL